MPKSKEQKQEEARQRKLATLPERQQRLLTFIRLHHIDLLNKYTFDRLANELADFHNFLKEVGLPYGNQSFDIVDNRVRLLVPGTARIGGTFGYKCPLCLQPLRDAHGGHCDPQEVQSHQAIFK